MVRSQGEIGDKLLIYLPLFPDFRREKILMVIWRRQWQRRKKPVLTAMVTVQNLVSSAEGREQKMGKLVPNAKGQDSLLFVPTAKGKAKSKLVLLLLRSK